MSEWLPAKYNALLFLVPALLYPAAGLLVGEPFRNPSVVDLVVVPGVIVLFGNVGYYVNSRRGESGVVDERDGRNIDLALAGTGAVLLVSVVAIYVGYATTSGAPPTEIDYLAVIGVMAILILLGGTEIHQRL